MRRILLALVLAGLLALPGPAAYADDPDPCVAYAAQVALPILYQSYQYSPQGYGGMGYAPLTYPFGTGPYGTGAFFGGPGLPAGTVPSFGPIGPGFNSVNLYNRVLLPSGYSPYNPAAATGTTLPLLGLQQAELANLNARYSNGAYYQTAAATWANSYAAAALSAFQSAQIRCSLQNGGGSKPDDTSTPDNGSSNGSTNGS